MSLASYQEKFTRLVATTSKGQSSPHELRTLLAAPHFATAIGFADQQCKRLTAELTLDTQPYHWKREVNTDRSNTKRGVCP